MSERDRHIGFTGTQRGWTTAQQTRVIQKLTQLRSFDYAWMDNGDCIGADASAAIAWTSLGGRIHLHPPTNPSKRAFLKAERIYPPLPYLERNQKIVKACSLLLATPGEMIEELRSGTWATVRYARKVSRKICIIFPDGSVKQDG